MTMRDEEHDRLVDVLLCELLGGEASPDLTEGVLARARPRGRRLAWWAAAAAVAVAGLGWALWPSGYPEPQASGTYAVMDDSRLGRGSTMTTEAEAAALVLGGYCRLALQPESTLRIEGKPRAEQVFLGRGGVTCKVHMGAGAFAVRTEVGTVSVAGTEFSVQLVEEQETPGTFARRMVVRVLDGAVLVSGTWGQYTLTAGEEKCVPEKNAEPPKPPEKPPAKQPDAMCLAGTIKGLDIKTRTIVVATGEGVDAREVTMRVCPRASIKVRGKDATLAELKEGVDVRVFHTKTKNGDLLAVRIVAGGCDVQ